MKYILLITLLFINITNTSAQGISCVWFFGEHAGITFNTADGEPIALTGNQISMREGCSTVSDTNGNFLFYTDGVLVNDRNHNTMPNGTALDGHWSSTQSSIVVPMPAFPSKYYIFTTDAIEDTLKTKGLRYSIVNMKLNGGLGDIEKLNFLVDISSFEKLTAVRHKNKQDIWVVIHRRNSDTICSYLVTPLGIDPPVINKINPGVYAYDQGYIKFSPDGKKMAAAYTGPISGFNTVYLYDFDDVTGKFSNPLELLTPIPNIWVYGVEFSPDGSKLYISYNDLFNKNIKQFNLNAGSPAQVVNSITDIFGEKGGYFCALQIGPNGKIYISNLMSKYLAVINKPNSLGTACNFNLNGVMLSPDGKLHCQYGLPDFIQSTFILEIKAFANQPCEGDTLFLSTTINSPIGAVTVNWKGPNGYTSNQKFPVIQNVQTSATGMYYVTVKMNESTATDSVYVTVNPAPATSLDRTGQNQICEGDSVILTANPIDASIYYQWNTGEKTPNITVKSTGRYTLTVQNSYGCKKEYSDSITVFPFVKPNIIPSGPITFCSGDSVILTANPISLKDYKYKWSSGETTPSIKVKKTGNYKVILENLIGCTDSTDVDVTVYPSITASIKPSGVTILCEGDSVTLFAKPTDPKLKYHWSTGDTTDYIIAKKTSNYWVKVQTENGCSDSTALLVIVNPRPVAKISPGGIIKLCEGESIQLSVQPTGAGYTYIWSTGDTKQKITVTETGNYRVTVKNAANCIDSTSIYVQVNPLPVVNIMGPDVICNNDSAIISADNDFQIYKWNTGAKTKSITVKKAGTYTLTVTDSNGCKATASITIKSYNVNLAFNPLSKITFGNVLIDFDSTRTFVLRNNNSTDINISRVFLILNKEIYITTQPALPALIKIGQQLTINIKFKPNLLGLYNDSLVLELETPCFQRYSGYITGTGTAKMYVSLPDTIGSVGDDNFCLPLTSYLLNGKNILINDSWRAQISFDATAFTPNAPNSGKIVNKRRIIDFDGNNPIDINQSVSSQILGIVLLPDNWYNVLLLDSFIYNNPYITIVKHNGSLNIKNICQPNISHIQYIRSTYLTINPNPADDHIRLNLTDAVQGTYLVEIFSLQGIKLSDFTWDTYERGNEEHLIDIKELSAGAYQLIINAPWGIESRPLIIMRK